MRFRYSRWDGTQRLDELDADAVLDNLSEDLMSYGDLNAALQRFYRWGGEQMPGLEQLLKQLREQRERDTAHRPRPFPKALRAFNQFGYPQVLSHACPRTGQAPASDHANRAICIHRTTVSRRIK